MLTLGSIGRHCWPIYGPHWVNMSAKHPTSDDQHKADTSADSQLSIG